MAVLKSTSSLLVAAAIAASLLALVSAAPLAKHRAARQAPTSASESMLSHVFAGLDVLYKVSVYEMMQRLNMSALVNASNLNNDAQIDLVTAIDVTCELYRAKEELIPAISNNTVITPVVRKINNANLNDSCQWLSYIVETRTGGAGQVNCTDRYETISDICRRWDSVQQFAVARGDVERLEATAADANVANWINGKNFVSGIHSTITTIAISTSSMQ